MDLCNHFKSRNVSFNDYRKSKFKVNEPKVNKFSEFIPIKFISREIESLGINSIFNDSEAMRYFPYRDIKSKKYSKPEFKFTTCYKYEQSIRGKTINYKANILSEDPLTDVKCYCHLYDKFIDPAVGHVITGNADVVQNKKLRKLFKKGYTFIEPVYHNKFSIFNSIRSDINDFVKKLAVRNCISVTLFDGWKYTVLENIKLKLFNSKIYCKRSQSILDSEADDLCKLKEQFILTGVDKAKNNVSFICKKYYLDNIMHELSTTSTYESCDKSEEDIVKRHV